jgi:murein DD-endopeptidase MepM/ murein hydrolase activator NlpD
VQEKIKKTLLFILIFILLFSCVYYSFAEENTSTELTEESESDDKTEEEKQIEDLQNQKSDLENAISSNEAQIVVAQGELSQTLEEIEILSTKIEEKRNEISTLETEELSLMKLIEEEEKKLEEYSNLYEQEKTALEKRLVVMYEMGETRYLDVLLNSSSLSEFLSKYYLLSEISEADYKLVSNVKKDKEQTASITEALEKNKEELEADKEAKEKYEISLSNMEILKNNKLTSLSEEEISLYSEIEEYRNQINSIESEIKELALKNLGKTYIGGSMIWPAPGYTSITSEFGMRTHPITGIYKLHTGVDIGAPYGANFVAANDGVVIKAYENAAYGKMVMIDHGGGVVTLYAHGSEICVNEGDIVHQGQTVLKVGSTGYSTGPHAHFEIRINGEYLNPMDYISPDNGDTDTDIEEIVVEING